MGLAQSWRYIAEPAETCRRGAWNGNAVLRNTRLLFGKTLGCSYTMHHAAGFVVVITLPVPWDQRAVSGGVAEKGRTNQAQMYNFAYGKRPGSASGRSSGSVMSQWRNDMQLRKRCSPEARLH